MFYILKGEKPTKKVVASGQDGDLRIEYIATRTREVVNAYDESGACVASIYNSMSIIRDQDIETTKTQVAGSWERIRFLAGIGDHLPEAVPTLEDLGFTVRDKGNGSANKVKGLEYTEHGSGGMIDMSRLGTSLEDYLYEIVEMNELAEENDVDLTWAERKNYRVLVSDEDILEFIAGLDATEEMVGFDTETTGLLVNRTKLDKLVGISMSYEDDAGVYFPVLHKRFDNVRMGTDRLLELLKPYCDRKSPKRKNLVTHNGGFDWKVLKMHDWDLNIVYDTFLRFGLMEIGAAKYMSGLKPMAKRMLNHDVIDMSQMYRSRTPSEVKAVKTAVLEHGLWVDDITRYKLERAEKFSDVQYDFRFASYDFSKIYGSADADFPRLIHKLMDKTWNKKLDFIYRLEIALIPVIGEQEYYGVRATESEFQRLYLETEKELLALEAQIYREAGREFKLTSPLQKAAVIFDEMGCPYLPRFKTKAGGRSTDKKVMKHLSGYKNRDGTPKYPIIALMSAYTKKATLMSNFYKKLPLLIHGGFLFPSYKQLGTETGRLSCYAPNLQQTEGTSRKYMIPDSDDYYFMICDYSQVEYRLMAGLSGETKVIEFFRTNPEADYHILAYANMMDKLYEDVTSDERKTGKTLNFGTTYGLEDENLALNLYGDTTPFHQMMARQARDKYFAGIPILRDYFEEVRDEAQVRGYAETFFGRIREIEEFKLKNPPEYKLGSGRRKAGNMPVQGTAADIMKMAMIRVQKAFRKLGYQEDMIRLVMNIHDELVIQVHKSLNTWYILSIVRKAMEMDMSKDGFPPLYIGANVGYSWADGKADELEAPVLLMDKKIKEVEEKLARGETLEPQIDQRAEWLADIRYFAVEQVKKEITENNFTTVEECHTNGRLVKYSRTFNDKDKKYANADGIIFELLTNTVDEVFSRVDDLEKSTDIYKWTPTLVVSAIGVEVEDTVETLEDTVKSLARYSRKRNTLRLHLLEPDGGFFSALDKMLVTQSAMEFFNDNQKFIKLEVQIGETDVEPVRQRGLLSGMVGLLKEFLTIHVTGGDYGQYEERIEDVGITLLKDAPIEQEA